MGRCKIIFTRKIFLILFFSQLIFFSCKNKSYPSGINSMHYLVCNYYQTKLSLIEIYKKKIVSEKTILDLTELGGKRIIQAGFLSLGKIYVVFQTDWVKYTERMNKVRIYDMLDLSWEDIFDYRTTDNIRIIDVNEKEGYFSGYLDRNRLMYLDFEKQTSSTIYEFPEGEEIITIDCSFSDIYVVINTFEKKEKVFHYYYIDKHSYIKTNEGVGQVYLNRNNGFIIYEKNSKIYIVDDLFNPTETIEIPLREKKFFSKVISVDNEFFILCLFSTSPNYIGNLLFGGKNVIEHYDYRLIRVLNNDLSDIHYEKIYKFRNKFDNKIVFDGI